MGEKGMGPAGVGAEASSATVGQASGVEGMGEPLANAGPQQQPETSGPDVGEIVGDVLDPLGIHKLFE